MEPFLKSANVKTNGSIGSGQKSLKLSTLLGVMILEHGVLHTQSTLEETRRTVLEKVPTFYQYAYYFRGARDEALERRLTK